MFGEPVRRAPIPSMSPEAVSITFELRKPSWRMRVCIVRSGASAARAATANSAAIKAIVRFILLSLQFLPVDHRRDVGFGEDRIEHLGRRVDPRVAELARPPG